MTRATLLRSRLLATALALTHAAGGAVVLLLQIGPEWKAALLVAVAASLGHGIRRHALLRSRDAIVELEVRDRERASIRLRHGEWRDARILATSCVTPALTAINLHVDGVRLPRHVILVRDNVDAEDFRSIRVLLRWSRPRSRDTAEPHDAAA